MWCWPGPLRWNWSGSAGLQTFIEKHVLGFNAYMERLARSLLKRAAEICDVPLEDIRTLARWYRDATPRVMPGAWSERNQTAARVCVLLPAPALAAKFGVNGGWVGVVVQATPFRRPQSFNPHRIWCQRKRGTINILDVGKLLLDENLTLPLKALFIYNHIQSSSIPIKNRLKQGLARDDLSSSASKWP